MPEIYAAIRRMWSSESHTPEERPTCQVWVEDKEPVFTGLVNAEGVRLYCVPASLKIGFVGSGKK